MAIQGMQGIESVLQQLQVTATLARNNTPQSVQSAQGIDFASQLHAALDRISNTQQTARSQGQQFALDMPGVSLNEVMVSMQKASIELQMGIQVRNKLVAAYHDIMAMQV